MHYFLSTYAELPAGQTAPVDRVTTNHSVTARSDAPTTGRRSCASRTKRSPTRLTATRAGSMRGQTFDTANAAATALRRRRRRRASSRTAASKSRTIPRDGALFVVMNADRLRDGARRRDADQLLRDIRELGRQRRVVARAGGRCGAHRLRNGARGSSRRGGSLCTDGGAYEGVEVVELSGRWKSDVHHPASSV